MLNNKRPPSCLTTGDNPIAPQQVPRRGASAGCLECFVAGGCGFVHIVISLDDPIAGYVFCRRLVAMYKFQMLFVLIL
jgi:hypothetical protein